MIRFTLILSLLLLLEPLDALLLPKPSQILGGAAAAGAGAFLLLNQPESLFTPAPTTLNGRTILITGGSTGMGLESAKRLAVGGASIVLTARSDAKGQAAVDQVQAFLREQGVRNENISYRLLDLDDLTQVKDAVATWTDLDQIDVLLNNAGIMALPNRELTIDGFERQIQSNHLGHFLLTSLLAPKLSKKARIVNVSSTAHTMASTGLDLDYMWTASQDYGNWKSYGQSKLANILFTQELQRQASAAGKEWTAVTLHPGVVATDLGRYLFGDALADNPLSGFLTSAAQAFLKTPAQGADTQIYLAARATKADGGKYFVDSQVTEVADFAKDAVMAKKLWEESETLCGVKFDLGKPAEVIESV